MSDIAIRVEHLTKSYKLYSRPSDRLREVLHPLRRKYHRNFAALKDLNFEISKGQILGIVGKNGSGKSTLLKILTGVLTPSSGSVEINGRVAALLELGAGFNPELTGRENIYLNGLMMGLNSAVMDQRIQGIIDFADIGEFLDQPVKMYSSGMFVRLAFAVAINVDPDIFIIDEALSVGDVRFQQKCIRKIQELFSNGKTVIFVGHDLAAIKSFCTRCLWINEGVLVSDGDPEKVIKEYSSYMIYGMTSSQGVQRSENFQSDWIDLSNFQSFGDREAVISKVRVFDSAGNNASGLVGGETIVVDLLVDVKSKVERPIIGFSVKDRLGNSVFGANTFVHECDFPCVSEGEHVFRLRFNFPYLTNGDYILSIAFADGSPHDHVQKHWVHDCFVFSIRNPKLRYQNGDGLVLENSFQFEIIQ